MTLWASRQQFRTSMNELDPDAEWSIDIEEEDDEVVFVISPEDRAVISARWLDDITRMATAVGADKSELDWASDGCELRITVAREKLPEDYRE